MRVQETLDISRDRVSTPVNYPETEKLSLKHGAEFVIQKDWGHLAQISLNQQNIILAEIISISPSSIDCKVAYKFDIISPTPVDITLAIQNSHSTIYSFEHIKLEGLVVESTDLDSIFCEIRIALPSIDPNQQRKLLHFIEEAKAKMSE